MICDIANSQLILFCNFSKIWIFEKPTFCSFILFRKKYEDEHVCPTELIRLS